LNEGQAEELNRIHRLHISPNRFGGWPKVMAKSEGKARTFDRRRRKGNGVL
jgi:hypothetical protein